MISLSISGKRYDDVCKQLFIRYIDAESIGDIPVDDVSQRVAQLPTEITYILIWKFKMITSLVTQGIRLSKEGYTMLPEKSAISWEC